MSYGTDDMSSQFEDVPRYRQQRSTLGGQSRTLAFSKEQHRVQTVFKLLDLVTECRLRDMQPLGRFAEVTFLRNGNKILKMAKLWAFVHGCTNLLG
jgi:hypothetical protein